MLNLAVSMIEMDALARAHAHTQGMQHRTWNTELMVCRRCRIAKPRSLSIIGIETLAQGMHYSSASLVSTTRGGLSPRFGTQDPPLPVETSLLRFPALPQGEGGRHSDCGLLWGALLFFLCWWPLSELTPLRIQTQMYAAGTNVWYHNRSKGAALLATVIGPPPSGPELLHMQCQGMGVNPVDHTAAKLCRLEAVQVALPSCRDLLLLTTVLLHNQHPQLHQKHIPHHNIEGGFSRGAGSQEGQFEGDGAGAWRGYIHKVTNPPNSAMLPDTGHIGSSWPHTNTVLAQVVLVPGAYVLVHRF